MKYMHPYVHLGMDVYNKALEHRYHILQPFLLTTRHHPGYVCQTFNIPLLPDRAITKEYIMRDLQQIMLTFEGHQFKVKIGVSRILRYEPTNQLQFFSCEHDGECIIQKADGERSAVYNHTVRNKEDMYRVAETLASTDIEGALERDRPDTAYSLICPTNMRYFAYKLDYLVGRDEPYDLPAWVKRKRCLVDVRYQFRPELYNNLCFFRCMAYHVNEERQQPVTIHEMSMFMCDKWVQHRDEPWDHDRPMHEQAERDIDMVRQFNGVYMHEIRALERFFQVDMYVYQGTEDGKKMRMLHFPDIEGRYNRYPAMHLLFLSPAELVVPGGEHFGMGHFVYITKFETLSKCYVCSGCNQAFKYVHNCSRHMRYSCTKKNIGRKDVFPGTMSKTMCNIVERLFRVGITVPQEDLYYDQFITYDFESLLEPQEDEEVGGEKTRVLSKHVPVSVGLCSSHERIDPLFLANGDPQELVKQFLYCILLMRKRMLKDVMERYKPVFQDLVEQIIHHRLLLLYEEIVVMWHRYLQSTEKKSQTL